MELHLLDLSGNMMKATIFNDGVSRFADTLKTGQVYQFSHGKVKFTNKAFTTRDFELTFDGRAIIQHIPDPMIPTIGIAGMTLVRLNDIATISHESKAHILAVMVNVGKERHIVTAKGDQRSKRDVHLIDTNQIKVGCTLWSYQASQSLHAFENKPVLILDADVRIYNERYSVNVGVSSSVLFDARIPEAMPLSDWMEDLDVNDIATFAFVHQDD
ncbi:hypothetical protein PINS_up012938 [Pythium insidiosum]|nr:hypothetical protein PINS_up010924 [Pythium insidiosum]GLE04027.1 hypothetical protein PINS_up012938 [Pythium insidiosum]